MSTVKATNFQNASSATANMVTDASGNVSFGNAVTVAGNTTITGSLVPSSSFLRNRIINGDMLIDQRNAGASVSAAGQYTLDRWVVPTTLGSKFTVQQSAGAVTPPTGFGAYLGATSSSAYAVLTGDIFAISQYIEAINFYDLAWGTASAATVTLSFWVRSSLTGTFGGAFQNSAQNRSYPFSYTISVANTWEQKSITVAGDTSGTWIGATNGVGVRVHFSVGAGATYSGTAGAWAGSQLYSVTGATSVVGTNGATLYITGVQLEQGTVATPFERTLYNAQLSQCQRYFQLMDMGYVYGYAPSGNQITSNYTFPVAMRTTATIAVVTNPTFGSGTAVTSYQATSRITAFFMTSNAGPYATWTGGQFSAAAEL